MSDEINERFSSPGIHGLVHADDFYALAHEIRDELLHYPDWTEMRQSSSQYANLVYPDNQNGITTGNLNASLPTSLPYCLAFRNWLAQRRVELCELVGVHGGEGTSIEINAMAYGEGSWLSMHSDHTGTRRESVVAWILYLTDPSDDEWKEEYGGALRLAGPARAEVRLRPRFNRFAMFRVSPASLHEIEKVRWPCGWSRCRLALSGWFTQVRAPTPKRAAVYLRSADFEELRIKTGARIEGSLALYNLMREQKAYCGSDTTEVTSKLSEFNLEYKAHLSAPDGASFLCLASGPAALVIIQDENGKTLYFGPRERYSGQTSEK